MSFSVAILTVLVLFMIAGGISVEEGKQAIVFRTPMFLVLEALACICMLWACKRRRPLWRQVAFMLAHAGGVLIMLGGAITHFTGEESTFALPIASQHPIGELPGKTEGQTIPLGFFVGCTRFLVDHYPPTEYHLYEYHESDRQYHFIETLPIAEDGSVDAGSHGRATKSDLCSADEWATVHDLGDGFFLEIGKRTPRHYEADLRFSRTAEALGESRELRVNHPLRFDGWTFYLMSYDQQQQRYVVLSGRRDPGRAVVFIGFWAVIVGTSMLCFRRNARRRREDGSSHGETTADGGAG